MRRAVACMCAVALVVTGVVAGCTTAADDERPGSPSQRGGTGAVAEGAGTQERRELTEAEQVLVLRAEQLLVKKCMEAEGFRYWVGPLPTADDLKGGGYVLTDVRWAKEHGYGSRLQKRIQDVRRTDRNQAYVNGLPQKERARYSDALEGSPSSGMLTAELPGGGTVRTPRASCLTEAKEGLYGDFETWFRAEKTAMNLTPLYVPALLADRRFARAVGAWSACMREKGHDYADPAEIREKGPAPNEGPGEKKAYAAEVALAVAEAVCARATPLAATAHTLNDEYRDKKLQRYSGAIATYQRLSLDALARAEKITGSTA